MVRNQPLITTIVLAVVIIIAASVYIYTTLGKPSSTTPNVADDTPSDNDSSPDHDDAILTIMYNGTNWNVSLSNLELMQTTTGSGSYIKTKLLPDIVLTGPFNYTGIEINSLIDQLPDPPALYTITLTALDDYARNYSMNETMGTVDIYDENGSILANETAIMIIAYQEEGTVYVDDPSYDDIGPFRVAFIGEDSPITSSGLWIKRVTSIEIHMIS